MNKSPISKRKLKSRARKKTNPQLAEAIALATKNSGWAKFAKLFSQPTKKHSSVNLNDIDAKTSMGDSILVPGRVLSLGEITKKIRICSWGISKSAREKLTKTRSEWVHILDEIKKNPKAEGIKIIQ